jgi:hypothetical protein
MICIRWKDMPMRDRGLIIIGLLLFLALITFPFWYGLGRQPRAEMPKLALPVSEKECVAPLAIMRTTHMNLLGEWRDRAVRLNLRTYTAHNGKTYAISLTQTCLQKCHNDKAAFCDRCHVFNGIREPRCWDCHVDPQLSSGGNVPAGERISEGEDGHG